MKVFKRQRIYPEKKTMQRQKLPMEWYATGFDPNRDVINNDFVKASKQQAPIFDTGQLDDGRDTALRGVDNLVVMSTTKNARPTNEQEKAKLALINTWRDVLENRELAFRTVGVKVGSKEARVWVYHAATATLFILGFAAKDKHANWLKNPVYHFASH